jgi:hypothetical protein
MRDYMERQRLAASVDAILSTEPSLSVRAACLRAGVSHASYLRWKAEPNPDDRAPAKKGRPPRFVLAEGDSLALRWLAAWTQSTPLALEYAGTWVATGTCPLPSPPHPAPSAELGALISAERARGGRWDTRLPRAVLAACRLSAGERAMIRGQKAANDGALSVRRVMTIRDWDAEGGIRDIQLLAGYGYVSDDVSIEQPFTAAGPEGTAVNRQCLATRDVYSGRWLGVMALSREGDAYTKVDIADHMASVIAECGLPYYWALERGPWENDFIDGVRVEAGWGREDGERWGGLDAIMRIRRKFKPQHKTIEGGFAYLQSRLRGRSTGVGSERTGELERATRIVSAAKRGNEEALRALWSIAEAADEVWQQMEEDNARAKHREFLSGYAVPNELWQATYTRRAIPTGDLWRLLPIKACRVVIKQRVSITLTGYGRFDFAAVDGSLPLLDNGHRLLVAFHPGRPEEGAQLFNGECRSSLNRDGIRWGEYLGTGEYLAPVPMEDFTGTGDYSAHKRARQAVQSELRAAKATTGGVVSVARRADAMGRVLQHATGGTGRPDSAATPAPEPRRSAPSLAELRARRAAATPDWETIA